MRILGFIPLIIIAGLLIWALIYIHYRAFTTGEDKYLEAVFDLWFQTITLVLIGGGILGTLWALKII